MRLLRLACCGLLLFAPAFWSYATTRLSQCKATFRMLLRRGANRPAALHREPFARVDSGAAAMAAQT